MLCRFSVLVHVTTSPVLASSLRKHRRTDTSGAIVGNATVTIRDVDRDVAFTTTTNESGNCAQRHLIVGHYEVWVEATGFRAFVESSVNVSVDAEVRLNVKLQVGDLKEVVQATGESPLLKTERSDVAITYDQKAVNELPIMNRRFSNFSLLTPESCCRVVA